MWTGWALGVTGNGVGTVDDMWTGVALEVTGTLEWLETCGMGGHWALRALKKLDDMCTGMALEVTGPLESLADMWPGRVIGIDDVD